MADLKITALPALVEAGVQAVDVLALADLSATETKKVTVKDLVAAGVALIDDGDIPAAKVGTLGTNQVATGAIQDGAVSNVKLANSSISLGGISIALGATDASPAFNLADATGYLTTNLSGTITNAQLAGSIANAKLANSSISLGGISVALGGSDATPAFDLADATNYPTSSLTGTITNAQLAGSIANAKLVNSSINIGGVTFNLGDSDTTPALNLSDATSYPTSSLTGTITNAQLAGSITGAKLTDGTITATQLDSNSVTATELADNAVDTGAIANLAVTNGKINDVSGSKITDGTITAAKLATANIDRSLNVANNNLGINNTVVAATRSGITYNAQGLITATVALAASDLPLATTSAVGGVSVGTGLAVTGAGALSLSNSVTAATISGITYNAQGQITATTALVAGDLPAATTSAKGAVLITSGGGISVDGSGAISTSTSGVTAGTYGKVTVDVKGVVTSGANLIAGDIPDLSATKITSGTFDVGRFGTNTITGVKFADSSVCQFTGAQSTSGVVTFPTAEFKGQFFYDLTNDDLYVYDGSAFQPVTITSGEIIYAGNYRADTNKITSLTAAGTAQGYTINAALQAASAANNRYYFVCDKSGTGTSPAPTVTINPPDMILSNGSTYEKLDISNFIAGQVASNIGVTATGGIQNTNVQSVLEELDTEKLNTTGGTLTGNLALNQSSSIIFEGSTPDDFETTLTVIDPTADRTVSLPNVTGTLVSTGDTGTVTSTMILDGTILNADINASAAIALTKLANVTAAHIIVGNGSNVPTAVAITGDISISNAGLVAITADSIINADIKSDAAIAGSKIVAGTTSVVGVVQLVDSATSTSTTLAATGASVKVAKDAADAAATTANAALATTGGTLTNNLIIDNAKQIRFTEADANGANFVSLQAPDALAADVSYTLPSAAPTANGQVLAGTTAGVLSWTDDPTGQWVTNGTNVYYDGGNVGIGVGDSPSEKLEVEGTVQVLNELRSKTGNDLKINAGSANRDIFLQVNDSTLVTLQGSTNKATFAGAIENTGGVTHNLSSGNVQAMFPDGSQVNGVTSLPSQVGTPFIVAKDTGTGKSANFAGTVLFGGAGSYVGSNVLRFSPAGAAYIDHETTGQDINFRMSTSSALDTTALVIKSDGKIGIGTVAPPDEVNIVGTTRINQSTTLDHLCNAGTVLEVRGNGIGSGVVDTDFFKGFKIALNDGPEYGGQAQFAVGRWEENGTNARSSLMISLGHGAQSSSSNADADVLLLNSDKHAEFFGGLTVDGTTLHVDAANNRCGIGTTSPGSLLELNAANDTAQLKFLRTGTTIGGVIHTRDESGSKGLTYTAQDGNSAVPQHCFQTNNGSAITERFRITHDGTIHVNSADSASGGRLYAQGSAMYIQDGNGRQTFKVSDPGSGNSYTWELNSSGNLAAPSGGGIDFSASPDIATGETTTSQVLNDYEEGEFVPAFRVEGQSSNVSTSTHEGKYTKIGNACTVWIYAVLDAAPSGTGSANAWEIRNLPFVSSGDTNHQSVGSARCHALNNGYYGSDIQMIPRIWQSTSVGRLEAYDQSDYVMRNASTYMADGAGAMVTITYCCT